MQQEAKFPMASVHLPDILNLSGTWRKATFVADQLVKYTLGKRE